jgi:hypothetical protein
MWINFAVRDFGDHLPLCREVAVTERAMSSSTVAVSTHSAADLRRSMAERDARRAAEQAQAINERETRQKAVYDEFQKPPARTKKQIIALVMQLVRHAAEEGAAEVQVYQFPAVVCSDRGRAINNFSPDWPESLTGRAQLAYQLWQDDLKPLGFGLKAQILDYPGGFPGDVGLFLTW